MQTPMPHPVAGTPVLRDMFCSTPCSLSNEALSQPLWVGLTRGLCRWRACCLLMICTANLH